MYSSRSVKYPINSPTTLLKPTAGCSRIADTCEGCFCYIRSRSYAQKIYALILILGFVLGFGNRAKAQDEMNYAVQANIIYHFTRYIDWPAFAKSDDFVIGVIGDTPLYVELKKTMKNKMAGDKRIIIKTISTSTSFFDCHILFISQEESYNIKRISALTKEDPILLVTEQVGLARKGACINFVIVDDRLQLEINKNNITERKLNIASELLQLGKLVK